ncbi:NAD(P)H-dependent oxidoreductase [Methylobacterium sp. J-076]|uniref:NAD(P)H-dependent oxidoreductase n=1 Tax=Methylobacterium sp. J-076 TaxID=2836655 RepID=UPI001FBB180F|nr:NAD(P)H-dependent oxidoreductase [Methylobacterium sp. J-076]MCJ2015426.1 NAD(P)H-dependent oxidoreductase [Methylobacterium sp. J-076]
MTLTPRLPRVVAFAASAKRPARTRFLVEAVAAELSRLRRIDLKVYDLIDAGPGLGVSRREDLTLPAARLVDAIENADALILGTPVYQGGYAGLFKHVFDFVDPAKLAGRPVVLTATGGGLRHSLVVEHSMRPLFGFFAAHVAPTSVYAGPDCIAHDAVTDPAMVGRIAAAASELSALIEVARAASAGAAA